MRLTPSDKSNNSCRCILTPNTFDPNVSYERQSSSIAEIRFEATYII
jgi:hypothetical protein